MENCCYTFSFVKSLWLALICGPYFLLSFYKKWINSSPSEFVINSTHPFSFYLTQLVNTLVLATTIGASICAQVFAIWRCFARFTGAKFLQQKLASMEPFLSLCEVTQSQRGCIFQQVCDCCLGTIFQMYRRCCISLQCSSSSNTL